MYLSTDLKDIRKSNYGTWEHIVPRQTMPNGSKKRKKDEPLFDFVNNKKVACRKCNEAKDNKTLEEYCELLKTQGTTFIWADVIENNCTREQYDTQNLQWAIDYVGASTVGYY